MSGNEEFNIWEGIFPSFDAANIHAKGTGFDGEIYQARALEAAQECLAALKAGVPIPPFHKQRSNMVVPIAAMMLGYKDRLRILDLGGGLGIGFMTLLEGIPQAEGRIEYSIVEVAGICDAGRRLFGEDISYLESLPVSGSYDLIYCSSMLQYVENWQHLLGDLAKYGAPYWLLSDIFAGPIPTFVTLQNYYGSRIKHWFLNLNDLLDVAFNIGYELKMQSHVTARRLKTYDQLPMNNFPASHRLGQTLHLLFHRKP